MSRRKKHKHEEHTNHEAWAIPYGDLVTLLLAFFVVLYAISSVNEGKYRVLSDALFAAFRGTPRSMEPIQVGEKQTGSGADLKTTLVEQSMLAGQPRNLLAAVPVQVVKPVVPTSTTDAREAARAAASAQALERVADEVLRAMDDLVQANLVMVRRKSTMIEVEIRTDILFPSGSATLSPSAVHVIERLANALQPFPNSIRVEGHTDSRPINTLEFPSNWELSAGRAASVVHVLALRGIDPTRLAVIGLGEFSPAQSNATVPGRNANRRVVIVIMSPDGASLKDIVPKTDTPDSSTAQTSTVQNDSAVATAAPATTAAATPANTQGDGTVPAP
jgi:chemotaxis protein MotB